MNISECSLPDELSLLAYKISTSNTCQNELLSTEIEIILSDRDLSPLNLLGRHYKLNIAICSIK